MLCYLLDVDRSVVCWPRKVIMFAIITLALFAGNVSSDNDGRLAEVDLSFTAPKVEMAKDTTAFIETQGNIKPLNLTSAIKVERVNPKYNPVYFGK